MLNPKIYSQYFIVVLLLFVSYHLTIWNLYTSQIFKPENGTSVGDLGRLSYQIDMIHNRKLKYTLQKQHLNNKNYKNREIDIITIGDSFSKGGAGGENSYYQDFLATNLNANVLNLSPYNTYNSLETLIGLYNNGYLGKIKPKIVLIESVERLIPGRYSKKLNFAINDVKAVPQNKSLEIKYLDVDIINTANFKLPLYTIQYYFKDNAIDSVYKFNLNKELFSINNGKKILIFRGDMFVIDQFTPQSIAKVNENLNRVAKLLKNLNIKLYFMPAPDKYDMYYDFIKDNKFPKNPFFDLIRPLKKEYVFVDTKKILLPLLNKGVKDLYWIDDTHWSQKASSAVSKDKVFKNY